jgi:hypothetical protein
MAASITIDPVPSLKPWFWQLDYKVGQIDKA